MIEQFNFDIRLIFAILNGKVSAAINRKLYRNFRQNGLEISPEQKQPIAKLIKNIFSTTKIIFTKDLAGKWRVCKITL